MVLHSADCAGNGSPQPSSIADNANGRGNIVIGSNGLKSENSPFIPISPGNVTI
jgi:hypothetical protein